MNPTDPTPQDDCVVYLIDDDRAMVQSTAQWLSLSGLKVRSFADPALALRSLGRGMACVIVSDIRMPQMDGMELMRHVLSKDRDIPVILITGHGDVPLAVEAMKSGAKEFLTKPFSPEKLLDVVQEAIAERIASLPGRKTGKRPATGSRTDRQMPAVESGGGEDTRLADRVDEYEKKLIIDSLARHQGNILAVMEELDLPRRTLNAKMKKFGISRRDVVG